jgi:hypothetical protein
MNFKPKAFNILILIWTIMIGSMSAVGLIQMLHQTQIMCLLSLIHSKEDYYFKIIISFIITLMLLKIYQAVSYSAFTIKIRLSS